MINKSSNNLLSRSGNSMKGVNFDISYAQRKMSNYEQKSEEQKIAEEVWNCSTYEKNYCFANEHIIFLTIL